MAAKKTKLDPSKYEVKFARITDEKTQVGDICAEWKGPTRRFYRIERIARSRTEMGDFRYGFGSYVTDEVAQDFFAEQEKNRPAYDPYG